MRYLKTYKLFENIDLSEATNEIRDYLSNLEDIGFYFDFYPDDRLDPNFHKIKGLFQVEISKYSPTDPDLRIVFDYNEIKPEVDRLFKLVSDKYRCAKSEVKIRHGIIAIQIDFYKKDDDRKGKRKKFKREY